MSMNQGDVKRALLGDHEAAKRLTEAGVLLRCPFCGSAELGETNGPHTGYWVYCRRCTATGSNAYKAEAARLAWNTRAPVLSERETEMLEGME